jgi:type I restriction enzyme M protein
MIVGKTKSDVDALWNAFWTGGVTNPISVIEQINYLLFIRRLDDIETRAERVAVRKGQPIARRIFPEDKPQLRWSNFRQQKSDVMFKIVQDEVFPFIKKLGESGNGTNLSTFSKTLSDATFLIPKPSLLASAVELINGLDLDNPDTAGDLYEYLLSKLSTSGINGQFRTPRHIIRMMVELIDPDIGERICDPACGTAGFLFTALNYILEKYSSPGPVRTGDKLSLEQRRQFDQDTFYGFDFDTTMSRIASMNMWLHGIESPQINHGVPEERSADTLSKGYEEANRYDIILANPPFKGSLDYADCNPSLLTEQKTKKTELLFLVLALRLLDIGGRAAIIVPDGVLFGSSNAHVGIRKTLVEGHQLEGVISMPSGVFKPYAGVSTAVLLFTKGGQTDRVWFYEMEHDGLSLDDKRNPIDDNDIPDVIDCWKRKDALAFNDKRQARMADLRQAMAPLKTERLVHHQDINRLQFESVLNEDDTALQTELANKKAELATLDDRIHLLQREFNQLSRQFWVSKGDIAANKYDLSASRYRQLEQDETYYPDPKLTLERMQRLEDTIQQGIRTLEAMLP